MRDLCPVHGIFHRVSGHFLLRFVFGDSIAGGRIGDRRWNGDQDRKRLHRLTPPTEESGEKMIVLNLDVMLAKRKMSLGELSEKVGITLANLSILKNNKAKAIRFSTLDAICRALDCEAGDIIEYRKD